MSSFVHRTFEALNKVDVLASLVKGGCSTTARLARASAQVDRACSRATKPVSRLATAVKATVAMSTGTGPDDGKSPKTSQTGGKRRKEVTPLKPCLKTPNLQGIDPEPSRPNKTVTFAAKPKIRNQIYLVGVRDLWWSDDDIEKPKRSEAPDVFFPIGTWADFKSEKHLKDGHPEGWRTRDIAEAEAQAAAVANV